MRQLSVFVLMLLASWHSAVAQVCTLPELADYPRLIMDTYQTSVTVGEIDDVKFVCVSDDVDSATLAVRYNCNGQECERVIVEALIDLQCSADTWRATGRSIVSISNIQEGNNCSICMNATEREQTYPDDERATYTEDNHCLVIHKCYREANCSGSVEEYVTKEECCFIMEDGISYHTEEGCQNCIVHGFVSDLYEVAEGGTVEVELKINLKGTTMFPFLQVHGVITSDNSTDIEAIRLTVDPLGITFNVAATDDDIAAEDDSVILRFAHDFGPLFIERVIGAGEFFRDTTTVRVIDTDDVRLSFSQSEYTINENELDDQQNFITVNIQNPPTEQPFNLLLTGVEYTGNIDEEMKATPNVDFETETVTVEIPAMREAAPFRISLEDIIIDDNTVEPSEIEKFLLRGKSEEGGTNICFVDEGETECTSTTTKDIAINDTDYATVMFTELTYMFMEGDSDFDVCVTVDGESDDSTCPVEFSIQITVNFTNMNANMPTNGSIAHPENGPFSSGCLNITFQPCEDETCVDIRSVVGVPLDDDTLFLHRMYNYTIVRDKLMLGRPRYDRVIQDDSTGTFVVIDNDPVILEQENGATEYTVYEDQGPVEVCVDFVNTFSEVCPVNYPFYIKLETIPSDTARPNEDYIPIGEDPGTGLYQFQQCQRDKVCVKIDIVDDNILEGPEMFTFNLSVKLNGNSIMFASDQGTGIVHIKDPANYTVSMTRSEIVVMENVGKVEVCAMLSANIQLEFPLKNPLTVQLKTVDGVSTSSAGPPEVPTPRDYERLETELEFRDNDTKCVNITIIDDKAVELSTGPFREEFSVVLERNASTKVGISGNTSINIRIRDNDVVLAKPEFLVYNISENARTLEACAVIIQQPGQDCPFDFHAEISISTDAGSAGSTNDNTSDYDALSVMSPLEPCEFETCQTVTIRDDDRVEGDEVFFITLERAPIVPIGRIEFPMSRATVNLRENDMAVVGLTQTVYDVVEDEGMVEVCVKILHGSIDPSFHINFTTTDGNATSPKHYTSVTQTLEFGGNDRETKQCVNIEIKNVMDVMDEYTVDGFVIFNVCLSELEDLPPRVELKPDKAVVRIIDKENAVCDIELNPSVVDEGGEVEACLVVINPVGAQEKCNITTVFEVNLLCSNCDKGGCTSLKYGPENCNKDISETSQCCRITFEDDNDSVEEGIIMFMLLQGPDQPPNILLERPSVTVTYTDNDMAVVGFLKERYRVSEEEKMIEVCVEIKSESICPVNFAFEVTLSTVGGSAIEGSDYSSLMETVEFPPCHKKIDKPRCVNISIINDTLTEALETFTVALTGDVHENIMLDPNVTVVEITDERIPEIGIEMEMYKVNENESLLEVCLVTVASIPIEDCANQKFELSSTAESGVEVIFDTDGCMNKTCVNVTILDDMLLDVEPSTFFDLTLTRTEGDQRVDIDPDRARVEIRDNEMVVVDIEKKIYRVNESTAGGVEVCAIINDTECLPGSFEIHVDLSTVDGSAIGGEDFERVSDYRLSLSGCKNSTHPIRDCKCIELFKDTKVEDMEFFNVTIEKTEGIDRRVKLGIAEAIVTLADSNDAVTINLKPTVYKVNESDGEVDIFAEVEIEDNDCPIEPAFDLSVSITRDGDDSDGIEIFLPFVSCENRGYVTLPIINDDVLEHKLENFTVTLAQSEELAANVHLGPKIIIGDRVGKISIEDDEPDVTVSLQEPFMIVSAAEAKDMSVCITTTGEIGFPFKYILEIDGEEDDDPVEVDGSLCAQRDVLKDREVGKDDIVEISLKLKRPDDLDTRILLDDMIMIVYVTLTGDAVMCYNSPNCTGPNTVTVNPKECCVGTDESVSYSDKENCGQCVVHGFEKSLYEVEEGNRVNVTFKEEVKGESNYDTLILPLMGVIKSQAVTADPGYDYEDIGEVKVDPAPVTFGLLTINDDIALEYDDRVNLMFNAKYEEFVEELEKSGEFLRDTVEVKIIDNDDLEINFDQLHYAFHENGSKACDIKLQHRKTQGCFTVHFESISMEEARERRVIGENQGGSSDSPYHATLGMDFRSKTVSIIIPPSADDPQATKTSCIYEDLVEIVDDNVNEFTQTFVLYANITLEEGLDMSMVCFQDSPRDSNCYDTYGVVIQILDNDPMEIGFADRQQILNEQDDQGTITITITSNVESEKDHSGIIDLLASRSNATVMQREGQDELLESTDAQFGGEIGNFLEEDFTLVKGSKSYNFSFTLLSDSRAECDEQFTLRLSAEPDVIGRRDLFSCNKDTENTHFCYHTIIITEPCEPCMVGFEQAEYTALENDESVDVCVTLTCPANQTDAVTVVFANDSSIVNGHLIANGTFPDITCGYTRNATDDYEQQIPGCSEITVDMKGQQKACYQQVIYYDVTLEKDEYFGVSLEIKEMSAKTDISQRQTKIKILDNDTATVGFSQTKFNVTEGDVVEVCAEVLTPEGVACPFSFPVTVLLSTRDESAEGGRDYDTMYKDKIVFKECQLKACVNITTIDDGTAEHSEMFYAVLGRSSQLDSRIKIVESNKEARVTINDNDVAYVRLTSTVYTVDEGDSARLCLLMDYIGDSRDCPYGYQFEVYVVTEDGTAVYNLDYRSQSTSVMFTPRPNSCDRIECISIPALTDNTVDTLALETFTVLLDIDENLYPNIELQNTEGVVNIRDIDMATFGLDDDPFIEVTEGDTGIRLCVGLRPPFEICPVEFPVYFNLSIQSNSDDAAASGDFSGSSTDLNNILVRIPACERMACLHVPIIDDMIAELRKEFEVTLLPPDDQDPRIKITDTTKRVVIVDNDEIMVGLSGRMVVVEDEGLATVCAVIMGSAENCPANFAFRLLLTTEDIANSATGGSDYDELTDANGVMTLGKCEHQVCWNITINYLGNERKLEKEEHFIVNLEKVDDYSNVVIKDPRKEITIIDGGEAHIEFDKSHYFEPEGTIIRVCAVVIEPFIPCPIFFPFEINITTHDRDAVSPEDFTAVDDVTLSFGICQTEKCIYIPTTEDCIVEETQVFAVEMVRTRSLDRRIILSPPVNASISDDDSLSIRLSDPISTNEDDGDVQVCAASTNENCHADFSFNLDIRTVFDAADIVDFVPEEDGILRFGQGRNKECINITIIADLQVEQTESFDVLLERRNDTHERILVVRGKTTVNIINDDVAVMGFTQTEETQLEEGGRITVCVEIFIPMLDEPVAYPFNIRVRTVDGTAVADEDFRPADEIIRFGAGKRVDCFEIELVNDRRLEDSPETFTVKIERPVGSLATGNDIMFDPDTLTVEIYEQDTVTIGFDMAVYTVAESETGSFVRVCAVMHDATPQDRLVDFEFNIIFFTLDGSAHDGTDYVSQDRTVIRFQPYHVRGCVRVEVLNDCVMEDDEEFNILLDGPNLDRRFIIDPDQAEVLIKDNDGIRIGFEYPEYRVEENGGSIEVCATILNPNGCTASTEIPFLLDVRTSDDSAASPGDYTGIQRRSLAFAPNDMTSCVIIDIANDDVVEQDESFEVILEAPPDLDIERVVIAEGVATVKIDDDDETEIGLYLPRSEVAEDGGVLQVCVRVTSPRLSCPIVFPFEMIFTTTAGTALSNVDFELTKSTLRFSACETSQCLNVTIINDNKLEGPETFTVNLQKSDSLSNKFTVNPSSEVVTITDDDTASVGFTKTMYTVEENIRKAEVCVVVDNPTDDNCLVDFGFDINLSIMDGSAVYLSDYEENSKVITFPPCNYKQCVDVPLVDDCVVENTEEFRLFLFTPPSTDRRIEVTRGDGTVLITDSDAVTVSLDSRTYNVMENNGTVSICAVISGSCSVGFRFEVNFTTSDDSADSPADFVARQGTLLPFAANQMESCVEVLIADDDVLEQTESFDVHLERVPGLNENIRVITRESVVNILNDDMAIIGLELDGCVVDEGVGAFEVCVVVTAPDLPCPILFPFEMKFFTRPGTAKLNFEYDLKEAELRFSACAKRQCLNVAILEDLLLEETETFTIHLEKSLGLSNEFTVDPSVKVINITDNDVATVGFKEDVFSVRESYGAVRVCVSVTVPPVSCPVNTEFTVNIGIRSGTAVSPGDYDAPSSMIPLVFRRCDNEECTTIDIVSSDQVETVETFSLELSGGNEDLRLEPSTAIVEITDDSSRAVVDLEETRFEVTESDGEVLVCAVIRTPDINCPVDFDFTINLSVGEADIPITFPACESRVCVIVTIVDDTSVENTETVNIALERPEDLDSRISIGTGRGQIIIADDSTDEAVVRFVERGYTVEEGTDGVAEVCLEVDSSSECPINFAFTVRLNTRDGSAVNPRDYRTVSRLLTVPKCARRICQSITIVNDVTVEDTESFFIDLNRTASLDSRISLARVTSRITITDDDSAVVGLQSVNMRVQENRGVVSVCIRVISPSVRCPVMVPFRLLLSTAESDNGADGGVDYDADSQTVLFDSCQRSRCVDIAIVDDAEIEDSETFTVSLASRNGNDITVEPSLGQIEILDNDGGAVGMRETVYQFSENGGVATVCVGVQGTASGCVIPFPISMTLTTIHGTAGFGDLTTLSVVLRMAPCGDDVCVDIPIADDTVVEGDETFTISLTRLSSTDARISRVRLNPARAQVTINDDDTAMVRISNTFYQVTEDARSVQVCADLTNRFSTEADCPVNFPVRMRLVSSDDTAVARQDYTSVSASLYFPSCADEACTTVTIIDDAVMEPLTERFSVSLVNSGGDTRITAGMTPSIIEITDNDGVTIALERSVYIVAERPGAMQQVCAVVRSPRSGCSVRTPISVEISTDDDTAEQPSDYEAIISTSVIFDDCSREQCVTLYIADDDKVEDTESLIVLLNRPSGLDRRVELVDTVSIVMITDVDSVTVQLESESLEVKEGDGSIDVCVDLSGNENCPVQFPFNVSFIATSSSAVADSDYAVLPTTVEFQECDNRLCVRLFILDDDVVENPETVTVSVRSGTPRHDRISFSSRTTQIEVIDNDNATVQLKDTFIMTNENRGSVKVCAALEEEKSIAFSVTVGFVLTPDSATLHQGNDRGDFRGPLVREATFADDSREACIAVTLVDSIDVEMPESFFVSLSLDDTPHGGRIQLSENEVEGEVEIMDDDEAVIGLEQTSYQLRQGADEVTVCVYISEPTPSQTRCPITFPFDLLFRLVEPSPDYFEVGVNQSPTPEGAIELPEENRRQDVELLFNSCQRRMCFRVSLKEGVDRPDSGEQFGIRIARTPDHGRNILLDDEDVSGIDDRTSGIITIQ